MTYIYRTSLHNNTDIKQIYNEPVIRSKHIKGSKERYLLRQKHNLQIYRGNPFYQATKLQLNSSWMAKNDEKWDEKLNVTYLFVVELSCCCMLDLALCVYAVCACMLAVILASDFWTIKYSIYNAIHPWPKLGLGFTARQPWKTGADRFTEAIRIV